MVVLLGPRILTIAGHGPVSDEVLRAWARRKEECSRQLTQEKGSKKQRLITYNFESSLKA